MAHGQDDDFIVHQAIQRDISAVAEGNQPFAVRRLHVRHRPSDGGMVFHHLNFLANGLDGTLSRIEVMHCQETIKALDIAQRLG